MNGILEVLVYAGAIVMALAVILVIDKVIQQTLHKPRSVDDEIEQIFRRDRARDVMRGWTDDGRWL